MFRKKQLTIIVGIVAVLLFGLISVQLYWIKNAYRLQAINFNEKVNKLLQETGRYAEENNASFYLYGRAYIKPGEGVTVVKPDYHNEHNGDTISLFNIFPYKTKPDTCFYSTTRSYYSALTLVDISMRFEYIKNDTPVNINEANTGLQQMNLKNFRETLREQRPVTDRLNMLRLDSFLKLTLVSAGLDSVYTFGLRKAGQQQFEYISQQGNEAKLRTSPFSTTLFNNIAYTTPYELVLFINNKDKAGNKTLTLALAASSLIILLLTSAFIYFFRTILRQKKLSEMKTDFINNMTHEFMTPVTNISLALETMQKASTTEQDRKKIMEVIGAENEHLQDNINKVLQVAVLDKGSFLLDPAAINIHELLERVAKTFAITMEAKHGKFIFDLQAQKPTIIADETHIINLFYNIVDNAIKYTGDNAPLIKLSSGNSNKKLWVSIEDNGIGMSVEVQKHIFDKFYRGQKGNTHDVKGFGLGMAYVKSIADAHGFTVQVKTNSHNGTTFTIWF